MNGSDPAAKMGVAGATAANGAGVAGINCEIFAMLLKIGAQRISATNSIIGLACMIVSIRRESVQYRCA